MANTKFRMLEIQLQGEREQTTGIILEIGMEILEIGMKMYGFPNFYALKRQIILPD